MEKDVTDRELIRVKKKIKYPAAYHLSLKYIYFSTTQAEM